MNDKPTLTQEQRNYLLGPIQNALSAVTNPDTHLADVLCILGATISSLEIRANKVQVEYEKQKSVYENA